MPSSISSSEADVVAGQGPNAHHGPLAPGLRLTASDRPGIAQPVPERDVPPLPWAKMLVVVALLVAALTMGLEWRARSMGFEAGDLGDEASAWAKQWRRLADESPPVAIVGDSRILFDTDLDRFQALTGVRPIQLALQGTNGRPFLEAIAASQYKGLVIVGMADQSYFRDEVGLGAKALDSAKWDSPSSRISYVLFRELRRRLAFLDDADSLSHTVTRTDDGWRKGAPNPYGDVWKVGAAHDERQFYLWPQIEQDAYVRDHAISVWRNTFGNVWHPAPDVIARTIARTKAAVAAIRARGGDVVFVHPPSAPQLRALEDKWLPPARGWDPMLKAANAKGVHSDDLPAVQDVAIPEMSHISKACSTVFTDAYVRALTELTSRIHLVATAPAKLNASNCR